MQLQLKHLPFVFLAVAAICLTGAFAASTPDDKLAQTAAHP